MQRSLGWAVYAYAWLLAVRVLCGCNEEEGPFHDSGDEFETFGDSGEEPPVGSDASSLDGGEMTVDADDEAPPGEEGGANEEGGMVEPGDSGELDASVQEDATTDEHPPIDAAYDAAVALDATSDAGMAVDAAEDASGEADASADTGPDDPVDASDDADATAKACGGPDNLECGEDEYCSVSSCAPEPRPLGVCLPRPHVSECEVSSWRFVCGCNGKTYWNACAAHAEGVSVGQEGICGYLRWYEPCGVSEFSDVRLFCTDPTNVCVQNDCWPGMQLYGRCMAAPSTCPELDEPACVCDTTVPSACAAFLDGRFSEPGACVPQYGRPCHEPFYIGIDQGCMPDEYCNTSKYCRRPGSSIPGEGFCQRRPESCPQETAPVCSCGGVTYVNECEAFREGASVASQGPC